MAFSSYTDLQSQIATWLARDDLTAYIPDFITLFECAAARRLKVRLQETTTTLTPVSGVATLPADYLGVRSVTWTGDPRIDLDYVHPSLVTFYNPSQSSGTPTRYTISGTNLTVDQADDTDLSVIYYAKSAAVSGTLNSIFSRYPDVYLFGSLCEAGSFNKDVDAALLWKQRRDEVFREIELANFNEPSGLTVRVIGNTP